MTEITKWAAALAVPPILLAGAAAWFIAGDPGKPKGRHRAGDHPAEPVQVEVRGLRRAPWDECDRVPISARRPVARQEFARSRPADDDHSRQATELHVSIREARALSPDTLELRLLPTATPQVVCPWVVRFEEQQSAAARQAALAAAGAGSPPL
ncbi:hypothetical protein ACFV1L_05925 [Kitasatospora sp. NPDC059646]|uniref:hypothetical protein n=1 Tax=Kitasatospora sp. NPDC059646 TaxID=3346893 RepID=UPI003689E6C0